MAHPWPGREVHPPRGTVPGRDASHNGTRRPAQPHPRRSLGPGRATAFGPNGGDNPQLATWFSAGGRSGRLAQPTGTSSSSDFGKLYPGTGLLLKMGPYVTITGAHSTSRATGASLLCVSAIRRTMAGPASRGRTSSGASWVLRAQPPGPAAPLRARSGSPWLPTDSPRQPSSLVPRRALQGHAAEHQAARRRLRRPAVTLPGVPAGTPDRYDGADHAQAARRQCRQFGAGVLAERPGTPRLTADSAASPSTR